MPIGTIVSGVIAVLAMKGAEKITEKSAEKAFENRSAILEKVRGVLIGEELTVLNLLEEFPTNPDIQTKVAEKLTPRLEANPVVANEIEELLKQMPMIEIKQNTLTQTGNNNKAAQDIHGSTINFK